VANQRLGRPAVLSLADLQQETPTDCNNPIILLQAELALL
jgi:hypothetical protein